MRFIWEERKRIGEGKVESFELRVLSYGEEEREF